MSYVTVEQDVDVEVRDTNGDTISVSSTEFNNSTIEIEVELPNLNVSVNGESIEDYTIENNRVSVTYVPTLEDIIGFIKNMEHQDKVRVTEELYKPIQITLVGK